MTRGGRSLAWVAAVAITAASSASAQSREATVLVTPVQGSPSVLAERQDRIVDAVARALRTRGYAPSVMNESLGRAVVACQTPECVERTLRTADAVFAVVPAIWVRGDDTQELTLTLVRPEGRNLNVDRAIGDDLSVTVGAMVGELLHARAAAVPSMLPTSSDAPRSTEEPPPRCPHAWIAGPVVLLAGGAAVFIAIGVGAATKRDDQQLNTTAVAAWSIVGAAAIAGGTAWWVVGARRRRAVETAPRTQAGLALRPTGIDLRLRF